MQTRVRLSLHCVHLRLESTHGTPGRLLAWFAGGEARGRQSAQVRDYRAAEVLNVLSLMRDFSDVPGVDERNEVRARGDAPVLLGALARAFQAAPDEIGARNDALVRSAGRDE